MTMTKRCLPLVLALCMLVCLFPASVGAVEAGTTLTATEIPGLSRLEKSETSEETADRYAPDAQILSMKVFDDEATGAQEYSIISALEDAAILGADVMNLSLGSDNGFAEDDTAAGEVYDRLTDAGIIFMISAGNAYYSSMYSNYGDYDLAANPEISMIAAPSIYDGTLSVASVNSTVSSASYLQWSDAAGNEYDAAYSDPADVALRYMFAGDGALPVQIIPVDGYGTYTDYYNAGFRGYYGYGEKGVTGIALVKRGGGIGKLELKDDPGKTGSYELSFTVHNLSGNALTYDASVTLLRPATDTVDSAWGQRTVMTDSDVTIKEVSLGDLTVPANGEVTVAKTVTLTAAEKAQLDELFPNGIYVEGFVTLASDENPTLGLPLLAFYGDWTAAPIYDNALWVDEVPAGQTYLDLESTWGTSIVGYFDGNNFWNLAQNVFDNTAHEEQPVYYEENIALSPNGLGATINDFSLHQLRQAKLVVVEVTDKETGEVYFRDYVTYLWKDYYYPSVGAAIPASQQYFTETNWNGTDLNGDLLPNNTQCVMTITAYGEGDYRLLLRHCRSGGRCGLPHQHLHH